MTVAIFRYAVGF